MRDIVRLTVSTVLFVGIIDGLVVDNGNRNQGDTQLVGSSLHQVLAEPPDLLAAGDHSAQHKGKGKNDGGKGYYRTHSTKGGDGYQAYDSFHKKDGDKIGYEKHSAYGNQDSGDDGGEYAESSSYDTRDKAGTANKPKFTSYHYETKSGSPVKKYNDEGVAEEEEEEDDEEESQETKLRPKAVDISDDVEITGPLIGPMFQSLPDKSNQKKHQTRRPRKVIPTGKKTKDPQAAATEGDYYYEGGDGEEGDEGEGGDDEGDYYSSGGEGDYY